MSVILQGDDACPRGKILLGNQCVKPKLLKKKTPLYPNLARRAKVVAAIDLVTIVQPDGTIGDVQVTKGTSLPRLGFEDSAIAAVKKWQFKPLLLNGKPVSFQFKVKVEFKLSSSREWEGEPARD